MALTIVRRRIDARRCIVPQTRLRVMGIHGVIDRIPVLQPGPVAGVKVQDLVGQERAAEAVGSHLEGVVVAVGAREDVPVALAGRLGVGDECELGEEEAGVEAQGLGEVAR